MAGSHERLVRAVPEPGRIFAAVLGAAWLLVVVACIFWLLHAATWRGWWLALAAGATASELFLLARHGLPWRYASRRRQAAFWGVLALSLLVFLSLPVTAPGGTGGDDRLIVEHVFLYPRGRFPRFALGNMVPEADQIAAGIGLARWTDRFMDGARARRLRRLALPIYGELAADPAFADMGSALTYGYRELRGHRPRGGHYVAVVPRSVPDKKPPCVLFLHGSGGNFAAYWMVLAALAREHGLAVICPTFGFGNWHRDGGVESALAAVDHAERRYDLDPENTFLAALSNGGRGATRIVAKHPDRFKEVILVSAVLEQAPIDEGADAGAWRGTRLLLIHGEEDRRIPVAHTLRMLAGIEAGGGKAETMIVPGEDHFLFFSRRGATIAKMAEWVSTGPSRPER